MRWRLAGRGDTAIMEVELKLTLAERDTEALRRHPLLKAYALRQPQLQTMADIYFDTPGQDIRHSNAGLRVRQVGSDWIQTMKGGGSVEGGLHSRHEWESLVTGPQPDLAALRDLVDKNSVWASLLRTPAVEQGLAPIFKTSVQRMVWDLRLPQGDLVECVLDQGQLACGELFSPISELELELKSGDPVHLFDFALQLQEAIPMHIGTLSKAERGYALFAPQPVAAVKATPLKLTKRMTVEQVFQAIMVNCMTQVQANEAGVSGARDVESLHQMRVGLRRLRSALALFRGMLPVPQDLLDDIDWLSGQLGAARDWDVLAGSTLPVLRGLVGQAGATDLEPLLQAAQRHAATLHGTVAEALTSPRYTGLVLRFTRWVLSAGWREHMTLQEWNLLAEPLRKFAGATLTQDQRRLHKRGRRLHNATPQARHRVRIAAKKARYALEFFRSLYTPQQVRSYLTALSDLQDGLGWMNDVAVADRLLVALQDGEPALAAATGYARGYLACRGERDAQQLQRCWKRFAKLKQPA
jgi:inorganic triphosphatase YgiF